MSDAMIPWVASEIMSVPADAQTAQEIVPYARQHLRPRESRQLLAAFDSGNYEMATTFIWAKAMAVLKAQIATLGSEFVGEMLQRPDIDEYTDISTSVTDSEAISLAEDLGMMSHTECFRMRQSHEVIMHFAKLGTTQEDEDDEIAMNPNEALSCLRSCVANVLAQPSLEVAETFAEFRRQLEEATFDADSDQVLALLSSPYFYRRTTLSVLLALLKTSSGAALEHVGNNVVVIVPSMWNSLKKPQRWQAGQTYAELFSEGDQLPLSYLKKALMKVQGFDYVPESLRSNTYTRAAKEVLLAHEAMNNYYKEVPAMKTLVALGTTIPEPAFPICMTAALSVWLGNRYGHSWDAAPIARSLLESLPSDRWVYFLDGCLQSDQSILLKLFSSNPQERWCDIVCDLDLGDLDLQDRDVQKLIRATVNRKSTKIVEVSKALYSRGRGRVHT